MQPMRPMPKLKKLPPKPVVRPIRPDQIKKTKHVPGTILECFNSLIHKHYKNGTATIEQSEIVDFLVSKGYNRNFIFDNKLLDIEGVYEEAGWNVVYDKNGYCENYCAKFIFTAKK